jgi:hypothetical protein
MSEADREAPGNQARVRIVLAEVGTDPRRPLGGQVMMLNNVYRAGRKCLVNQSVAAFAARSNWSV